MLSPLLVIGVGGSGGKTIRSMKQALRRQLDAHRYEGDIPAAWQFLQFDTTYDGKDFPPLMLPRSEFHQVVGAGEGFYDVLGRLENLGTKSDLQEMLSGWGIARSEVAIAQGAGQQRAIGRQVGIANSKEILGALKNSIAKMRTPASLAELDRMADALGAGKPGIEPRAIIIASLAGGSGAGMFIDIAELLKRADADDWARDAVAVLYTAEVFESLGAAGADVRKNTLGAMNEVIAGKWNGLSPRSLMLLEKLSIPKSPADSNQFFGCKGNILVGARNAAGADIANEVGGAGMDEVFLTIGEALSGAFSDESITEFLYNRAFVNIIQKPMTVDKSGLAPQVGSNTMPFSGIGFGKLSLGLDRVTDYVADAMTERQINKLLWPLLNTELLKDGLNRSDLIENKSSELWPNFLNSSGLNERGSEDQVLDELRPGSLKSDIDSYVTSIIRNSFAERPQEMSKVSRNIWSEWESGSEEEFDKYRKGTRKNALLWRQAIQKKVLDLVANELAMNGYSVTISLLQKLEEEITNNGVTSLKREKSEAEKALKGFDKKSWDQRFSDMAEGKTGLSTADRDVMSKSRDLFMLVMNFKFNHYLKDLAASLLEEFVVGFLVPLREILSNSRFELEKEWNSENLSSGQTNPKKWFPEWGSGNVPKRYLPRTIERTMIPASEYETIFSEYAGRDSGDSDPFKKSIGHSLLGIKLDVAPGVVNEQNLISIASTWVPSVREAQETGEPAAKAQFTLNADMLVLSTRNRVWLKDPKTSFGALTDMSIRQFVMADGDPDKRSKREDKFVESYQTMLGLAQPLVKLNRDAIKFIKNVDDGEPADGVMRSTSRIPFSADSNVGKRCTEILRQIGEDVTLEQFEGKWFDASSSESMLYATSTTQASLPAWAFESLTGPIAQQAAMARNDAGLWNQFWDGRRGRPIREAIPFSEEIRKSMITGWFIARLLNMVELEDLPVGRSAKVWNPNLSEPDWSAFPKPLISSTVEDNNRDWLLPSILVSGGLALVEFGQSGNEKPLHAYQLLKFLGREVTASKAINRDFWDDKGIGDSLPNQTSGKSTALSNWISKGICLSPDGNPTSLLFADTDSPEARLDTFLTAVDRIQSEYSEAWMEVEKNHWSEMPQTWELKEDINRAFHDLRVYLQSLNSSTAGATSI